MNCISVILHWNWNKFSVCVCERETQEENQNFLPSKISNNFPSILQQKNMLISYL
jgi:hypothetical protein